jgi:hypothetical protein
MMTYQRKRIVLLIIGTVKISAKSCMNFYYSGANEYSKFLGYDPVQIGIQAL